jgi:hypothetical protein
MGLVIVYYDALSVRQIVRPAPDWPSSMAALAVLTVPAGTPYEVVDESTIAPSPEELKAERRAALTPYSRAFFEAMKYFPGLAEGDLHLLDSYTKAIALARTADPYGSLVVWNDRIVQIIRLHPDMDVFAEQFSVSADMVDLICEVAMAIEGPLSPEAKGAAIAALLEGLA